MIAKITSGGRSFKGAFQYYLHDKNQSTRERVAWTHTENLLTDDPDKAWKVMAYTAKEAERLKEASGQKATGRKLDKPVFAYSLSWHPEQDPDKSHMLAAAKKSLEALGLSDYETVIIAHRDEPQRHVHIIVNRVHSLTGIAANTGNSKLKLSDFAREYEREHGKIYCQQREDNHRKRTNGEPAQYRDQVILRAWEQSDNGRGFQAALQEKGYALAQGRKRLVVVDPYGQVHNPTRHLEKVRAKDFENRLKDIALCKLPDAAKLSQDIQAKNRRRYFESLKYDEWAAQKITHTQDRHLAQRAETSGQYLDRVLWERDELNRFYRLGDTKTQIQALQRTTTNPKFWKRILGITARERAKLEALQQTYHDAQKRADERLGKIEAERKSALSRLEAIQGVEKRRDLEAINNRRPREYADEKERENISKHLDLKAAHRPRFRPGR